MTVKNNKEPETLQEDTREGVEGLKARGLPGFVAMPLAWATVGIGAVIGWVMPTREDQKPTSYDMSDVVKEAMQRSGVTDLHKRMKAAGDHEESKRIFHEWETQNDKKREERYGKEYAQRFRDNIKQAVENSLAKDSEKFKSKWEKKVKQRTITNDEVDQMANEAKHVATVPHEYIKGYFAAKDDPEKLDGFIKSWEEKIQTMEKTGKKSL